MRANIVSVANQHRVSAILLAAGKSQRMGERNKLLLPLWRKTVLELVLGALLGAKDVGEVIVVTGEDRAAVEEVLPEDQILKTFADIHNIGS